VVMRFLKGFFALALFSMTALIACDGHPGGTVVSLASNPGDDDEGCLADEVCDAIQDGDLYCLRRCKEHDECDSDERCNGTSGDNGKACHPKDLDDDDPDYEDCGPEDPDFPDC